jgi:hypothetical protein
MRDLMAAAEDGAAHAELTCLDKMAKAKADTAVSANPTRRNVVVDLCALEAVHGSLSGRRSWIAHQR